jgi:predicted RNA-binding Zn-ribbon protein involved in translation (DUF1610 family)
MDDDDLPFRVEHRTADAVQTITCPHCYRVVPLPTDEPWLVMDGQRLQPTLVSFLCPQCGEEIHVGP